MTEALELTERASLAIRIGESHFREFKSAMAGPPGARTGRSPKDVAVDIARTLVAFANADGGELLVGVKTTVPLLASRSMRRKSKSCWPRRAPTCIAIRLSRP